MTAVIVTTQGITLTSTGTSVSSIIPADSSNGIPRRIKVTANAVCFVKVGVTTDITATTNDVMVSPGEALRLNVGGCAGIAMISFSGTAKLNVVAEELGHWNYLTGDSAIDGLAILRRYGANAHAYIPGIGSINGLVAGNYLDSALTTPATVDGLIGGMVDPLGGINATASGAARPTLRRGVVNLLTWSQDFTNAAWVAQGTSSKSSQSLLMPAVGDKAYQISVSAAGTFTIALVLSGTGTVSIHGYNATNGDIGVQQITLTATPTIYTTTISPTVANSRVYFGRYNAGDTATTVLFGGAGLFTGTLTAAQILAQGGIPLTTTAAASNPSAGQYSNEYNGAQALTLGSVPFQMADDHFVIAAGRMDSAGFNTLVGLSGGANGRWKLGFQSTPSVGLNTISDANSQVSTLTGYTPGDVVVVSAITTDASNYSVRRNGSQIGAVPKPTIATLSLAGIGTTTAGIADYLVGVSGVCIIGKGAISAADALTLERFVASMTPNAPTF